ncbi:MAG: TolC family protein [Alphaproteobacteria bacterium]
MRGFRLWASGVIWAAVVAGPALGQTLESELEQVLSDNPRIVAAQRALEGAGATTDEAFAAYLPTVELSGDAGYEHTSSPTLRRAGENPLRADRESGTLTLTENIFDGFRRDSAYGAAKLGRAAAEINVGSVTQDILFEAVTAYHEVLRNARLIDIALADEETVKRQLQLEDERVKRGSGIAVDVLLSKARLQISKERRVLFEGRLGEAKARYIQVINRPADPAALIEPTPPVDQLPEDLDTAVGIALDENPRLRATGRLVEAADKERDVARSEYFPRLDLVSRANWEDDVDGIGGIRKDYSALLRVTWELFSGFATNARVARAAANYGERLQLHSDTRRRTAEEVRLAWESLLSARERVGLLQNAVNIAAEVFDAREKLREAGKESAINVLDAQSELNTARLNFVNASYDARIAVYRLLRAMGRLTSETLGLKAAIQ